MHPVSDETVLATLPRMMLAFFGSRGLDATELARDAGLGAMSWDEEDERVPRESVDALWELALARTGDPSLGVALAAAMPAGNAGVVELAAGSARTIGEAMAVVARYWRLLNGAITMRASREEGRATLEIVSRRPPPLARAWLDLTAVGFVEAGRRATARQHDPLEIRMPWPRTHHPDPLEAALGVPVRHDAPCFAVVYDARFLEEPLLGANQALHRLLETHAERSLA